MRENSYMHKPRPRFYGPGKVYLGLELEVEAPDGEKKREGLELQNPRWAYAKRDGSLAATGWEMVTHPISMVLWLNRQNVRDYHNIPEGTVLTAKYKGVTYTATMKWGGQVEWNGTTYSSISAAGKAIRGGKSTNGYQFFRLTKSEVDPALGFFALVTKLRQMGYTSHENGRCGFHIHISREAFSDDGRVDNPTFFRFKYLVNGALFRKLSQRKSFSYCQQEPVTQDNFKYVSTRNSAVNFTLKTVEVRIFRGNLHENRLRKNIEAVIAALEFSKELMQWRNSQVMGEYDPPTDIEFIVYVKERNERFPNLVAYIMDLERRGELCA